MRSMTGYGFFEYQNENIYLSIELKSYNNRFLDISVSIPSFIQNGENTLRKYLTEKIQRGKIELYLKVKELKETNAINVDENAAAGYIEAINKLKEITGVQEEIKLSHLLNLDGILKKDNTGDSEILEQYIMPAMEKVYADYDASCVTEGEATKCDICSQLAVIENNIKAVEDKTLDFEESIKKNLRERFFQLLGDNVDESRIYAETALMLVKFSINEELVRLHSHLNSFKQLLDSSEPVGKRMDFICQELNREINTIGSKSTMVEIDQAVINLKDALENIREQVRNII